MFFSDLLVIMVMYGIQIPLKSTGVWSTIMFVFNTVAKVHLETFYTD